MTDEFVSCPKCLTGRSHNNAGGLTKAGDPCETHGCDGVLVVPPEFKDLVDELPEPMTCGRRWDCYVGGMPVHRAETRAGGLDRWQQFKSNGDRVCSFCGSLHPDDFWARVKEAAEAPADAPYGAVSTIDPSDKGYKIYVHRPGVRNAHEGGIKFYVHHFEKDEQGRAKVTDEQQALYNAALHASRRRHMVMLNERFPLNKTQN